jgi:hypothetical protein
MAGWSPGRTPTVVEGDFGPVTMTLDRGIRDVLRAYIRGEGGHADAALRRWRYNVTTARDLGLRNILVVLELSGAEISKPAMAAMVAKVADMDLEGFRVAIVQTHHERQSNDESGVLVAMEFGITVRVFSDELPALIWLHHGER